MRSLRLLTHLTCVLFTVLMLVVGTASAQTGTKINPPLQPGETVISNQVSSDGRFVVFEVGTSVFGEVSSTRLYSFELATHVRKEISPVFANGRNLLSYQIAPNGQRVVYRADQAVDNRFDLYSVAITGGTPVKISRLANNRGDATDYKISPDSARVVYEYEEELNNGDDVDTLFSVAITGGAVTRLSSNTPEVSVGSFFFTPGSDRVLFEFQDVDADFTSIFSVPTAGGQVSLVTNKFFADFYAVTADSKTFVYIADYEGDDVFELYSVPVAGGRRRLLSQQNQNVKSFRLANPFSAAVYAYRAADDMNSFEPNAFGVVAADGSDRYNIPVGKDFSASDGYQLSPDNRGIVFSSFDNTNFANELFSITLQNNGQVRKLVGFPETRGVNSFRISPDGSRVVFLAFPPKDVFGGSQLFSVSINGGAVTKLSNVPNAGQFSEVVNRFDFTADGSRVVFPYSAQDNGSGVDVYSNSITGGSLRRAANNVDDDFSNFYRVAGSNRIVFTRTTYVFNEETYETTTTTELFKASL